MRCFFKRYGGWLASLWIVVHGAANLSSAANDGPPNRGPLIDSDRLLWEPAENTARRQRQEDALREALEAAETPLEQAQAQLAWANWLLAEAAACPATRWLLGFEEKEDLSTLAAAAGQARERLDKARKTLESISPGTLNDEERRQRNRLLSSADTLDPFARLFAALADRDDEATFKAACADAAVELSASREAADDSVAASARLWQSFGWAMAERRDRALLSLAPTLKPPEQFPYDFFSRLLRCRIALQQQQYAAVTALAIQMRRQMEPWFRNSPAPERLNDARRLAALLQYKAQALWLEHLREDESPQADTLEQMLNDLENRFFPEDAAVGLFCLERAVPLVVEPPEIKSPPDHDAASPPATPATSAFPQPTTSPADSTGEQPE